MMFLEMKNFDRYDYIENQFYFLEEDYGFLKKEVLRINFESSFKWKNSKITVEIIDESFSLPWSVIYKKTEKGVVKFTEPNHRMGLSKLFDSNKYSSKEFGFFKKITDQDYRKRIDFLKLELMKCITEIIKY